MTRKIGFLLLIVFLFIPIGSYAQSGAPLASVVVELWPEYDRPSMLVIYHINLSPTAALPYSMSLSIPVGAGAPNAVAVRQVDGSLVNIPYNQKKLNAWSLISFQATTLEIQLEFYDPAMEKQVDLRSYNYTWPGDFSTDELSLDVQRPIGAENMRIIPGMATPFQRADGLTYYHMNVGPLSKGQSFEIKVKYQKLNDNLSINDLAVAPSAPLDTSRTGAISITSFLPWVLGIIGLALIIGGGVWYWRSGHQKWQPETIEQKRRSSQTLPEVDTEDEAGRIYCHQCGKRAFQGDRFCRVCGAPLR